METAEEVAIRNSHLATLEALVRPHGWVANVILSRMKWQCEQHSKEQNAQGE